MDFAELEQSIDFTFKNKNILVESLTHRSYLNEFGKKNMPSNERLEFLGDAVLELSVTKLLFETYAEFNEGDLTSFRSALVRTESLAEEANRLKLGKYIFMSRGEEATGGRERPYILANTFEALIGGIYVDSGFDEAHKFIHNNVYYKVKPIVEKRLDIDPKTKLQELAQEEVKVTPSYELVKEEGPDHNKIFTMSAIINELVFGTGSGESKQSAEQNAAQDALNNWESLRNRHFPKEKSD